MICCARLAHIHAKLVCAFRRSITLPTRVDANKVSASYADGILTVTLPKAEKVKPKQIPVTYSIQLKLHMNTLVRENRDSDRAQTEQQFISPPANVIEAGDGSTLEVEMSCSQQGLDISVENNELTITGRRWLPTVEGTLIHYESRPENFGRTFELDPSIDADRISARIDQGS